jgi:protein-arginine kinase activator protein McsA
MEKNNKTSFDQLLKLFNLDKSDFDIETIITEDETHKITTEIWKSIDGKYAFTKQISESKKDKKDLNLEELKEALKLSIEKEDYESASEIRDKMKELEELKKG